jgi:hypothetical protein
MLSSTNENCVDLDNVGGTGWVAVLVRRFGGEKTLVPSENHITALGFSRPFCIYTNYEIPAWVKVSNKIVFIS